MARIAGVDIPNDKRVVISLTYIYGIGPTTAKNILAKLGISEDIRVKNLSEEQKQKLEVLYKQQIEELELSIQNYKNKMKIK